MRLCLLPQPPTGGGSQTPNRNHLHQKMGGQTTISPPANVKCPGNFLPRILSSGIDTLYLAMKLTWEKENILNYYNFKKEVQKKSARLSHAKERSQEAKAARAENGFPCTKPAFCQPALEQELRSQPRRRRLPTGSASEKPNCHRLAGPGKEDD